MTKSETTKYQSLAENIRSEDLRQYMIEISNDSNLATQLQQKGSGQILYDPNPNQCWGEYLTWRVFNGNIMFDYNEDTGRAYFKAMEHASYELVDGKFIADGIEISQSFPQLTKEKLEKRVKEILEN